MSNRLFIIIAITAVLFSIIMFLFPQIDMTISRYFYQPERGFFLAYNYNYFHLKIFRDLLVYVTYGLITITTLMLICGLFFKKITMPLSPRICVFILMCFAIAPLFIVNDVLKNHWGRARPVQVQQFGGDKTFSPAWVMSGQCGKNCSFTSGETANVFCYLALLFIVRRKKLVTSIVLAVGALTALERIAQGDHFFSDTLLSGFIDYLLIWMIYQMVFKKTGENYVKNY